MLNWADYHPEVVETSGNKVPWPCEKIATGCGPCSQPTVAMGPDEELVAEGLRAGEIKNCLAGKPPSRDDTTGFLYHSRDGGLNWARLCEVPLRHKPPQESDTTSGPNLSGVGFLSDGTLLSTIRHHHCNGVSGVHNETVCSRVWVTRSSDRGRSWSDPYELDPSPYEAIGGNKVRFFERSDGTVLLPMNCTRYARPGKPLSPADEYEVAQVYASGDRGCTWHNHGDLNKHSDESDLLELPSGRILASTRYQRRRMPGDPPELVSGAGKETGSLFKQTAFCHSDDGGKTFSEHLLLTGWLQQTACLARLSDGTLVMPFGHKEEGGGQRFMVSYDDGQTWSKTVFELNKSGWYASSVILGDDTIVTVYAREWHSGGSNQLEVLRWKVPPKEIVAKNGFFSPRPAAVS